MDQRRNNCYSVAGIVRTSMVSEEER